MSRGQWDHPTILPTIYSEVGSSHCQLIRHVQGQRDSLHETQSTTLKVSSRRRCEALGIHRQSDRDISERSDVEMSV